jgi:hypothetical protein
MMVEKYEIFVKACTTMEQLYTIAGIIAEEFDGQPEIIEYFKEMCTKQLEFIHDKKVTHETLMAGNLFQPTNVVVKA